jgi:hypothetical protein
VIGFFAATVHPANGHIGRAERHTDDKAAFPGIQARAIGLAIPSAVRLGADRVVD